jgi:hypothetical protein
MKKKTSTGRAGPISLHMVALCGGAVAGETRTILGASMQSTRSLSWRRRLSWEEGLRWLMKLLNMMKMGMLRQKSRGKRLKTLDAM